MIITKTRTYRVNLGNYEHVEVGATVTLDSKDYPAHTTMGDLVKIGEEMLALMIEPDLDAAAKLTANENSFVYEPAPTTPPKRTERSTLPRKRN